MHFPGNIYISSNYESEERSMQNRHRAQRRADTGHKPSLHPPWLSYVCVNLFTVKPSGYFLHHMVIIVQGRKPFKCVSVGKPGRSAGGRGCALLQDLLLPFLWSWRACGERLGLRLPSLLISTGDILKQSLAFWIPTKGGQYESLHLNRW